MARYLEILPHPHRPTHIPRVTADDTPLAYIFTANVSGYKVQDVQVQVEDDEALVLRFGQKAERFELHPNACLEKINAEWNQAILTVSIPKRL